MHRLGTLLLVGICAASCGGNKDNPTSPSTTNPNTIVFTAAMRASNEVPPITNTESNASGSATITFNVTRTGSTITAGTMTMQFTLSGFPNGSTATLAHIHTGASGVAGGVLVNSGLSAATAISMPAGTGSFTSAAITPTDVAQFQQIIDNPANFYFNVHTTLNPGGAVRAQLVRQ